MEEGLVISIGIVLAIVCIPLLGFFMLKAEKERVRRMWLEMAEEAEKRSLAPELSEIQRGFYKRRSQAYREKAEQIRK